MTTDWKSRTADNTSPGAAQPDEPDAGVFEKRLGWLRFLRFVERQQRLDSGEPGPATGRESRSRGGPLER